MRQEATEEVVAVDPIGGDFIKTEKKASLADATKAAKELLGRYLSTKQAKKLELEIEKLKSQIGVDNEQDDKLIEFAKALRGAFDDK